MDWLKCVKTWRMTSNLLYISYQHLLKLFILTGCLTLFLVVGYKRSVIQNKSWLTNWHLMKSMEWLNFCFYSLIFFHGNESRTGWITIITIAVVDLKYQSNVVYSCNGCFLKHKVNNPPSDATLVSLASEFLQIANLIQKMNCFKGLKSSYCTYIYL